MIISVASIGNYLLAVCLDWRALVVIGVGAAAIYIYYPVKALPSSLKVTKKDTGIGNKDALIETKQPEPSPEGAQDGNVESSDEQKKLPEESADSTASVIVFPDWAKFSEIDVLALIPSSVMDDKLKKALRDVSQLGYSIVEKLDSVGFNPTHPFLVNMALLRLYTLAMRKTPNLLSNNELFECESDDHFFAHSIHYLRYSDYAYNTSPMIANRDIIISELRESNSCSVHMPRHVMFLDHVTRSIVVAIRGTASLSDMLTDLFIDTIPFPVGDNEGDDEEPKLHAHRGIALAAQMLLEPVKRAVEETRARSSGKYKDYRLVVTGHSLGAGTASLLGLLLSTIGIASDVYAYASPPIISFFEDDPKTELDFSKCRIHNFVLNEDLIPRCSRHELLRMLAIIAAIDKLPWTATRRTELIFKGELSDEDLESIRHASQEDEMPFITNDDVELYLPGTVYMLYPHYCTRDGSQSLKCADNKDNNSSGDKSTENMSSGKGNGDKDLDRESKGKTPSAKSDGKVNDILSVSRATEIASDIASTKKLSVRNSPADTSDAVSDISNPTPADQTTTDTSVDGTKGNVIESSQQYKMYKLSESAKLFSGSLITGDRMLTDHRTSSYIEGFVSMI